MKKTKVFVIICSVIACICFLVASIASFINGAILPGVLLLTCAIAQGAVVIVNSRMFKNL